MEWNVETKKSLFLRDAWTITLALKPRIPRERKTKNVILLMVRLEYLQP